MRGQGYINLLRGDIHFAQSIKPVPTLVVKVFTYTLLAVTHTGVDQYLDRIRLKQKRLHGENESVCRLVVQIGREPVKIRLNHFGR
jgi:hypothetical protein